MGFSGGGANVTKAHQHDSTVVQDGGALAANATQFGLTNGSLLYSDGTNIQELGVGASGYVLGTASGTTPTWEAGAASPVMSVNGQMVYFDGSRTALDIGSQNDVLTVSAGGLPTWVASAGSPLTLIDHTKVGGSTTTIDTTFTNIPATDMSELYCVTSGSNGGYTVGMQVYDQDGSLLTGANYRYAGVSTLTGTQSVIDETDVTSFLVAPSTVEPHAAIIHIILGGNGNHIKFEVSCFGGQGGGGGNFYSTIGGYYNDTGITGCAGLKLGVSVSNSIEINTSFDIYKRSSS